MVNKLEYVWFGGNGELRSKTKIVSNNINDISQIPLWNFDGSSTGQATGIDSEVILKPVRLYKDPFNSRNDYIVLCETYLLNMEPHPTNTRHQATRTLEAENGLESEPIFGIEHEFFLLDGKTKRPIGFEDGDPAPQGPYYCSVGFGNAFGRGFLYESMDRCLLAGLEITGCNLEVCPGQMELQVCSQGIKAADDSSVLKYILARVSEKFGCIVEWGAKPVKGDWNGSGCHVNFSTKKMREENGYHEILCAIEKLKKSHQEHILVYGDDNDERLTGHHETSDINTFSSGVANRCCSIRIPRSTESNRCGYFEDRRPSSSADMYLVTSKIFDTCVNY